MVVVAVAGGTGNVGRTIVEALIATGKHDVKILARKPKPDVEAALGVPIIVVDYADVAAVTKALEDNHVHTVISAINMMPIDGVPREVELIRAADASKTTKRMISSEWGLPHNPANADKLPSTPFKAQAEAELQKTKDLETTLIHNGFFLDYWGMPEVPSHMPRASLWLDIANNAAAVPGSGEVPIVCTHTTDVARLTAASLDLPKWDPTYYVVGDRLTWNHFVELAESAKGTKFKVVHDSLEKMRAGEASELPAYSDPDSPWPKPMLTHMAAVFGVMFEEGEANFKVAKTLNDDFPDIKTMTAKEMLDRAWKKS